MAKGRFTLLIPLNNNDGTPIPEDERDAILDELYVLADGYTLAGTVTGAFRMKDGAKQVDQATVVWVAIDAEKQDAFRRLAASIAARLKQEAIYLERSEGSIEFVRPEEKREPP